MSAPNKARLRNATRALLLDALAAAKEHCAGRNGHDSSRSVLAFTSGYIERQEPELADAITEILNAAYLPVIPAKERAFTVITNGSAA